MCCVTGKIKLVITLLAYVALVVVCDHSSVNDGTKDSENEYRNNGPRSIIDDAVRESKDILHSHTNGIFDKATTKRRNNNYIDVAIPPFADNDADDVETFTTDGIDFNEELEDDEGDEIEEDFPFDKFQTIKDMGEHEVSSSFFNDHGSRLNDSELPFKDYDQLVDEDLEDAIPNDDFFENGHGFRTMDGDLISENDNLDGADEMREELTEALIRKVKEHGERLYENAEMMETADFNLGISRRNENKRRIEKEKPKKDTKKQKSKEVGDNNKDYDDEMLEKLFMAITKRGSEETHCWDVVASMTCKRVKVGNSPFSKRVCSKKMEKRCTKVQHKNN